MANIYTRKAVSTIIGDEGLTAEEKTERLFSLYGQALDDGYISKSAAQAAQNSAIEQAKADAMKEFKAPDVKESEEYKALLADYDQYKAKQEARASEDFAAVKPKFFDAVYSMIDRADGAKPVKDQLEAIRGNYEEYFADQSGKPDPQRTNTPQYSQYPGRSGTNPTSEEDKLFEKLSAAWK